jgi:hypothetical protein
MPGTKDGVETAYSMIPVAGPYFAAFNKVFDFAESWGKTDPVSAALAEIRQQIQYLFGAIEGLSERVDQLVLEVARLENSLRVEAVVDAVRRLDTITKSIGLQPADDYSRGRLAIEAEAVANDLGLDSVAWQWTDIVYTPRFDAFDQPLEPALSLAPGGFQAYLALPTYLAAIYTWLIAIDQHTKDDYQRARDLYGEALRRHIRLSSVRFGWDRTQGPPESLPENIITRVTCSVAGDQFAHNGVCGFAVISNNQMAKEIPAVIPGSEWSVPTPNGALCTFNSLLTPLAAYETELQEEQGVRVLRLAADAMARVERTGSPREPYVGSFGQTPWVDFAFVYAIKPNGDLMWWKQLPSTAPGELAGWSGPRRVGRGWADFRTVLPAGGNAFFAVTKENRVLWYRHDGFNDGQEQWTGPISMEVPGWQYYARLVAGSDGVIYALSADGQLWWTKYDGYRDGGPPTAFRPPRVVGTGWGQFRTFFSGGPGILYAVRPDGVLSWYRHLGFATGTDEWEAPKDVGVGWTSVSNPFSVGEGVVYAMRPDGVLLWWRHKGWQIGGDSSTWDGPLSAGEQTWSSYRQIFPLLPATPTPVR